MLELHEVYSLTPFKIYIHTYIYIYIYIQISLFYRAILNIILNNQLIAQCFIIKIH